MKQLILTFFLVILCYSLFFDKKTAVPAKENINLLQENTFTPLLTDLVPDTASYFILSAPVGQCFQHGAYAGTYLPAALY